MSISYSELNHAYVLDNGNGNLMAYRIDLRVAPEKRVAEPIVDEHGEPAGYALTPQGHMLLGKQLEGTDFTTYSKCALMHMNFKAIPSEENRGVMVNYLAGWLKRMKQRCADIEADGEKAIWLIGCPTGWKSRKIREDYRNIFADAGFVNPVIVWESNAALAHFQASNPKYATLVKDGIVLCVDLGAYSDDATLIFNGEIKSVGGFVGASIIEKMLVAVNLREQETYRKNKKVHNPPELMRAVGQRFEMDDVFRSFMLLQGRWLKERYFNMKREGTLSAKDMTAQVYLDDYADFEEHEILNLYVNTQMMDDIIYHRPIRKVLGEKMFGELNAEVREEIGNYTWNQCLENFLGRAAKELPEFGEYAGGKKTGKKPVVILTGGASQMDFVAQTVENVYSNVYLETDLTPVLSIALGLADFAPAKINALGVDEAFNCICNETQLDEDGDEESVLYDKVLDAYAKFIAEPTALIAVHQRRQMVDAVNGWTDYEYHSNEIVSKAKEGYKNAYTEEILPAWQKNSKLSSKLVIDHMNSRFRAYLANYQMRNKELFAEEELDLEFGKIIINDVMPDVLESVLEDYDLFREVFADFPNPGRLNIFNTRSGFMSEMAEPLQEAIEAVSNRTLELMRNLFFNEEVLEVYVTETVYELVNALMKKKKEILGELIVEEYDEEEEKAS